MSTLLSFHKAIVEKVHDPSTSELLVIARGLGLRRIVCKLLQIYDSAQNLVVLVNASPEEASAIGEELGVLGCRKPGLRLVDFETSKRDRQDLYKKGGLISVTSQIFTVDMLTGDIPTHLITGIIVLHAERVTATSPEAFIARLYREKNKTGFLKAFTDQPEHITSGMSPLRSVLKELQLRTVHVYPRFHQEISESLGRDRSVLQLSVDMTEYMTEIHVAIVQCMNTTLSELKRSHTSLELDDLKVENAYFKSFDVIVRRQLDPVWHKVGPRTKQLVSDLSTLRRLLLLLLTEDALSFQLYLEGLIDANTYTDSGNARHNQSPWMLTEAANVIFQYAKRRCFTMSTKSSAPVPQRYPEEDEDAWDALREFEGAPAPQPKKPKWPDGVDPVLEELPKWSLVAAALQEIEEEMIRRDTKLTSRDPGTNTVLIMTSSIRSAELLREFLGSINPDGDPGTQGRTMMERKLRRYFAKQAWKKSMKSGSGFGKSSASGARNGGDSGLSEALRRKDKEREARIASRRRVRGGGPSASSSRGTVPPEAPTTGTINLDEEIAFALLPDFMEGMPDPVALLSLEDDFDAEYGMVVPEQTVIVRAYSDDSDDVVLSEIQPRFVIMYEPNLDFVRRIEVYKKSTPGLGVRVYLMLYNLSCEEAKYLTDVRREKDAFERLIKERGSMLMPILEERRSETNDTVIRTISTRLAGGRKEVTTEPPRVIVDMREFRSSLPSLLHHSNLLIIPATLTVGDYILTPDMCVERKSIPDLVSSFNSGRLYTQCETMSAHYKHPILLIEWEEHKSFSLETVQEIKSYAKPGKFPAKKGSAQNSAMSTYSIQAKLVLLTLTFPRVRIIWSSSPFATAAIFNDLKTNNPEPDPAKAVAVGAEDDVGTGPGTNHAAEELLRALPGASAKTVRHITSKVGSVREFCELGLPQVQEILGADPGRECYDFMHRGERKAQAGARKP